MKLYSHATAPNPRRVNVFIIEKNLEIETVKVDMQAGEHKAPEFLAKNLNGQIPVLELDDGSHLSESVFDLQIPGGSKPGACFIWHHACGNGSHRYAHETY